MKILTLLYKVKDIKDSKQFEFFDNHKIRVKYNTTTNSKRTEQSQEFSNYRLKIDDYVKLELLIDTQKDNGSKNLFNFISELLYDKRIIDYDISFDKNLLIFSTKSTSGNDLTYLFKRSNKNFSLIYNSGNGNHNDDWHSEKTYEENLGKNNNDLPFYQQVVEDLKARKEI